MMMPAMTAYRDPAEAPLRKLSVDLIKTYKHINEVKSSLHFLFNHTHLYIPLSMICYIDIIQYPIPYIHLFFFSSFVLHDDDDDDDVQVHVSVMHKKKSRERERERRKVYKTKMIKTIISLSRTLSFSLSPFFSTYKCEYLIVMVECVVFRVI